MARGRGKVGERGDDGGGGREGSLSLPLFFEKKNKNAGDHTRKPGDACMWTNSAPIGLVLNMATFKRMSDNNQPTRWIHSLKAHFGHV